MDEGVSLKCETSKDLLYPIWLVVHCTPVSAWKQVNHRENRRSECSLSRGSGNQQSADFDVSVMSSSIHRRRCLSLPDSCLSLPDSCSVGLRQWWKRVADGQSKPADFTGLTRPDRIIDFCYQRRLTSETWLIRFTWFSSITLFYFCNYSQNCWEEVWWCFQLSVCVSVSLLFCWCKTNAA